MEKCSIQFTIITNDESVFTMLFGKNEKEVSLGPGIKIRHYETKNDRINTIIDITKESIKDYQPEIGVNVVANIIAAWLVYRLTGKPVNLEVNDTKLSLKKILIRNALEQELKKCGFG